MTRTVHIVLRFDDPSPTTDHALERKIFAILGELDITATVAAVPFGISTDGLIPLTRDNAPHLIAAHADGIIEIAQHGYAHQHMSSTPKMPSEFWGVPADEQHRCIDEGHDQLAQTFGHPIRGFIPPWNTYDDTTAHHLAARSYTYLSGSLATPPTYYKTTLCLIPLTCDIHQLHQAYAEACRHPFLSSTIVVVMHNYDFLENTNNPGILSLQAFRETLLWLKQQPEVRFITLGHLAKNLGVAKSQAALWRNLKRFRLHWRLQRRLPRMLLMTHALWLYFSPFSKT